MTTTLTSAVKRTRPLKATDVPAIKWDLIMEQNFLRPDGAIIDAVMGEELGRLDSNGGIVWSE